MTEPDVTLTDYAVALECAVFLVLLARGRGHQTVLRIWFSLFFASVGIASFCGGTVHGFFVVTQSIPHAILWRATLLAVGLTALAMWAIGAHLLLPNRIARWIVIAAVGQFVLYGGVVLFLTQEFWVAIANYLPAVFFLLVTLVATNLRQQRGSIPLAAFGLILAIVAAVLQQLQVSIHRNYFNHNALFHTLQAAALLLLFLGARRLMSGLTDSAEDRRPQPAPNALRARSDEPMKAS